MPEKIRLTNLQKFDIIPMGIEERTDVRYFKFISALTHDEILAIFSDSENLATVEYIGADGLVATTYQDCVKMLVLSFVPSYKVDDNTTSDIYIVAISTDEVARGMQALNSELVNIVNTVVMMSIPMMWGEERWKQIWQVF